MLIFYFPWSKFYQTLVPMLDEVAMSYQSDPSVVIAKIVSPLSFSTFKSMGSLIICGFILTGILLFHLSRTYPQTTSHVINSMWRESQPFTLYQRVETLWFTTAKGQRKISSASSTRIRTQLESLRRKRPLRKPRTSSEKKSVLCLMVSFFQ